MPGATALSILEMRRDPHLLGRLRGGETRASWDAFHAAADGHPMTDEQLALYRECTQRTAPPMKPFKTVVCICGRRAGKTSEAAGDKAIHRAFFYDYSQVLSPGETGVVALFAADRRQARVAFNYIDGTIEQCPMLARMVAARTRETITLTNGISIEVRTSNFRTLRGVTLVAAVFDEAAYWRSEESANPDKEILAAVKPALVTIPWSQLLIVSSPYAKSGIVYDHFRRYFAREDERVLVWVAPSVRMNPTIDPAEVAAALEEDPAAARSEWLAGFRDDIESYLPSELVESLVVPGRAGLPPLATVRHQAFVDMASGTGQDSAVLAGAHPERDPSTGKVRGVLDFIVERRPPFNPSDVVEDFCRVLAQYDIRRVTGDRYAPGFTVDLFRRHGVTYVYSERTKSDVYREVVPFFTSGNVELLDNRRLVSQLCTLERRVSRGGRELMDHPAGNFHDDVANACCGALLLVSKRVREVVSVRAVGW